MIKEDVILPDGTRIPEEEIDWSNFYKPYSNNDGQTDAEEDWDEIIQSILDEESKSD